MPDAKTIDRVFDRGMKALDLEGAGHTVHDLRDTFATMHLEHDPRKLLWVSWMLGHKKVSTTLNRYTRCVPQIAGAAYAGDLDPATGESRETDGARS